MTAPRYLKAEAVAERLSLSVSAVYKMMKDGEIPCVRIGKGTVRVPEAALEQLLTPASEMPSVPYESIRTTPTEAAKAFEEGAGRSVRAFAEAWRRGEIEDTTANAELAIRALELRAALDRASQPA